MIRLRLLAVLAVCVSALAQSVFPPPTGSGTGFTFATATPGSCTEGTSGPIYNTVTHAAYYCGSGGTYVQFASGTFSWGSITGTLSSQTDLQNALNLKAPLASPTLTGTVTVPNGSVLGTPTSINLANATFPTLNQNTTGTAANVTGVVAEANGGTGANNPSDLRGTFCAATVRTTSILRFRRRMFPL